MTPVFCRISHDPDRGTYGDCLRACVASILDMENSPELVPHFAHDGADAETVRDRMDTWLICHHGLCSWWSNYDPDTSRDELLQALGTGVPYMLFGETASGGDHVVICQDGKVIHDPAWYPTPLVRGGKHGCWSVVVLARV